MTLLCEMNVACVVGAPDGDGVHTLSTPSTSLLATTEPEVEKRQCVISEWCSRYSSWPRRR